MKKSYEVELMEREKFSSRHPILGLIVFDICSISICLGLSFAISKLIGMNMGYILFLMALAVLPLAMDQLSNKSALVASRENLTAQHEIKLTAYKGSAYDMIKYGIVGIALFVLSGYFGMM